MVVFGVVEPEALLTHALPFHDWVVNPTPIEERFAKVSA
jgi:hypothetical protein